MSAGRVRHRSAALRSFARADRARGQAERAGLPESAIRAVASWRAADRRSAQTEAREGARRPAARTNTPRCAPVNRSSQNSRTTRNGACRVLSARHVLASSPAP